MLHFHSAIRSAVSALLLSAMGVLSARAAKDQVPDWVREAAAQKTPAYPPRTDAVVLLDDHSYTVNPDGQLVEHVRRAVRILRPQGRQYGQLRAGYSKDNKLRSIRLWSIGPDGHEYAVKDSDMRQVGSWAGYELYDDRQVRTADMPGLDAGAVAAIEYELQGRPYENDLIWIPEEDIPVIRERLTLNLPAGYTYKAAWKGEQEVVATDLEKGHTLWEVKDLPAIRLDDFAHAPEALSLASRLDVFYFNPAAGSAQPQLRGDWKDVGLWYEALAQGRNAPNAAIAAKAQELVAGKTDFRARVEAIADFVQQQIRYVAVEVGVGGHQPHPAADIFSHRYGDCKDKATLLSAMLSAVGIRSTWVMVDVHRGVISAGAPSIMGNHMIAAVELPADYKPEAMYSVVKTAAGKRFLLFDPTWEKTPFGVIEMELQGSDALLVDGASSQAIRIPVMEATRNPLERHSKFQLTADGDLSGTVHELSSGDIARERRYLFSQEDAREQRRELDHEIARDLGSFQIADIHTANVKDLHKELALDYHLKVEHVAQQAGPLLLVRPRVIGRESFEMDRPGEHRHNIPIDLGSTRQIHDVCEIELPAGYAVEEMPPSMNLDLDFASYHSKVSVEGQMLRYDRTYILRQVQLPAGRYADLEKLARIIATDESASALLKHSN